MLGIAGSLCLLILNTWRSFVSFICSLVFSFVPVDRIFCTYFSKNGIRIGQCGQSYSKSLNQNSKLSYTGSMFPYPPFYDVAFTNKDELIEQGFICIGERCLEKSCMDGGQSRYQYTITFLKKGTFRMLFTLNTNFFSLKSAADIHEYVITVK